MGLGDWILATGQARTLHERTRQRVCVVNHNGAPQWSDVFENNPRISRLLAPGVQRLLNCSGSRPYIEHKTRERWTWKRWDIRPGELHLTRQEQAFAAPYAGRIMIEPNTKVSGGNKAWILDRWQQIADSGLGFIQTGSGPIALRGVERVTTLSFRQAAAILAVSRAYVGPEGALHHAAAALGVPAVVLWSEFISPEFTGYESQRNIRHAGPACGMRLACAACRTSMEAISVEEVLQNLMEIL